MKKLFTFVVAALFAVSTFATELPFTKGPAEPTLPETAVYSLFGYYGGGWDTERWGNSPELVEIDENPIWFSAKMGWDIFDLKVDGEIQVINLDDAMKYFHVSFWSKVDGFLKVTFESNDNIDPKTAVQVAVEQGWNEIVIPLTDYKDVTFNYLKFFILEAYTADEEGTQSLESEENPVAYANAYFSSMAAGIGNTTIEKKAQKMIVNGNIIIVRDGKMFDLVGNAL